VLQFDTNPRFTSPHLLLRIAGNLAPERVSKLEYQDQAFSRSHGAEPAPHGQLKASDLGRSNDRRLVIVELDELGSGERLAITDRNSSSQPNHAFAGFAGAGSMLSRENTCFNADFFAAHLYAAYQGWTGECPGGDIGTAIETWWSAATSAGVYTARVYQNLNAQLWVPLWFQFQQVPY
jgi:hypothetical protein